MDNLQKGIVLQKYLLISLLVVLLLSVERYFLGFIPLTGGYLIPILFTIICLSLLLLYLLVIFITPFLVIKMIYTKSYKINKNKLFNDIGKYLIGMTISYLVIRTIFSLFNYNKIIITNKTNKNISIFIETSEYDGFDLDDKHYNFFNSMPPQTVEGKSTILLTISNIADWPIAFNRDLILNCTNCQTKKIHKKTSLFRTAFIIDDSVNQTTNIKCNTESNYLNVNGITEQIVTVNLCETLLKNYTIDIEEITEYNSAFLAINTPKQYEIIKAERILYWYPTIWSQEENLMQYIRLDDLQYQTTEILKLLTPKEAEEYLLLSETNNNVIDIRYNNLKNNKPNYYSDLDKETLTKSIITALNNPANFNYDNSSKLETKNRWLKYSDWYSEGDFVDDSNELFDVNIFDIYIKITFRAENGEYIRVLHDEYIIGN